MLPISLENLITNYSFVQNMKNKTTFFIILWTSLKCADRRYDFLS